MSCKSVCLMRERTKMTENLSNTKLLPELFVCMFENRSVICMGEFVLSLLTCTKDQNQMPTFLVWLFRRQWGGTQCRSKLKLIIIYYISLSMIPPAEYTCTGVLSERFHHCNSLPKDKRFLRFLNIPTHASET